MHDMYTKHTKLTHREKHHFYHLLQFLPEDIPQVETGEDDKNDFSIFIMAFTFEGGNYI